MTVQEGPATRGEKAIRSKYPVTVGLTAGTTKQTGRRRLKPQKSFIDSRDLHGS